MGFPGLGHIDHALQFRVLHQKHNLRQIGRITADVAGQESPAFTQLGIKRRTAQAQLFPQGGAHLSNHIFDGVTHAVAVNS